MNHRVQCRRCMAHRFLDLAPRCLVCGAESFDAVDATRGDLDGIDFEVIHAAEALDLALHDGLTVTREFHLAKTLREACRRRARALVGRGVL